MVFNIIFPNANIIEPSNFVMNREKGTEGERYIFFHFVNPIVITLNGKTFTTNPGAVILYSPTTPQIFRPSLGRLNHDYVDFELLDNEFFKKIHFPLNTIIYPRMNKSITATIKSIREAIDQENLGFEYEIDSAFINLLLSISRAIYVEKNHKNADFYKSLQENFEQLRLSLYSDPTHVTVSSLAESLGFSSSYFNKKYKEIFHVSPLKDINQARIEYVKSMLLRNNNIISIVDALGFANNEYFYRWFKKMTGVTPREYIEQNS